MTRTGSADLVPTSCLTADFALQRPDFSLTVRLEVGSEILVLFGPSGSGKTTTLNALAGLLAPDRGQITLDGQILFRRDPEAKLVNVPARRRRVGYVFQNYALFPHLTARETSVSHCGASTGSAAWMNSSSG